ncbi:MAG: nicotinamide-nucleotide adenylyltransferase [Candidatus Aenigmarchaeota archaeon]|nr:nicotinamide-nucleotide adenylyltransferase [Candidatus Aenigmarchaeota archaeon]
MEMKKIALFIGRFQPFHKGHLYVIKKVMKEFDEVVIGIGSVNKKDVYNPFSYEERKEMIRRVGIKSKIFGVEDVGDDEKWAQLVLKKAKFDVVITGSGWVKRCFKSIKKIINADLLNPEKYNGTKIREKILKSKNWEDLVPTEIVKYMKEIDGEERIKRLMHEHLASR